MKFAFSTLGCPDWSIEEVVQAGKELGYNGVEIRGIKRVLDLSKAPEFAPDRIQSTKDLFTVAGLEVVSIDSSASFCWPEKAKQENAFEEAARHVDVAKAMGARFVRVFGGYVPEGQSVEQWARTLADYLKRLGDVAAKKGVTVAIETHDSWRRASDLMPVVRMADHPNVRVLWDIAHPWSDGESIHETVEIFGEQIVHCHIKDHTADHKEALLGEGIIPLDEAFSELKRLGYKGYISLEWEKMWHPEIPGPEVAFPQAINYMRELDKET